MSVHFFAKVSLQGVEKGSLWSRHSSAISVFSLITTTFAELLGRKGRGPRFKPGGTTHTTDTFVEYNASTNTCFADFGS